MKWTNLIKKNQKNYLERQTYQEDRTDAVLSPVVKSIIHNHKDAVVYFDYKGDIIDYNLAFLELIAYNPNDQKSITQICNKIYSHFDYVKAINEKTQIYNDNLYHPNGFHHKIQIIHVPIIVNSDIWGTFCNPVYCH